MKKKKKNDSLQCLYSQGKRRPLSIIELSEVDDLEGFAKVPRYSKKLRKEMNAFGKHQIAQVYQPRPIKKIPKWIYTLYQHKKSPEEILHYVFERVKRAPNRRGLQLIEDVINEANRKGEAPNFIKDIVSQEMITQLIKLSNLKIK